MNNKFITIKEAATKLGVSRATLRNWDNAGKLRAYRHPINNYRIYKVEDVDSVVRQIENSPFLTKAIRKSSRKLYVREEKDL